MRYLCVLTFVLFFFSCQKTEVEDFISEDDVAFEKSLFTTYNIISNTTLVSFDWTSVEAFQQQFFGFWKAIEVITINYDGQIMHLDYSTDNITFEFKDICKDFAVNQLHCKYDSTLPDDPEGSYLVYNFLDREYLYMLPSEVSEGQPNTLKERPWGEILFWPGMRNIMVVYNNDEEFPTWLIFQKVANQ